MPFLDLIKAVYWKQYGTYLWFDTVITAGTNHAIPNVPSLKLCKMTGVDC